MKTCIFTVIKDEQDYLNDFIRYHLGIGIDFIFIYEDIDSASHSYITERYKDNVTLSSVSELVPIDDIMRLKKEGKGYQVLYIKKGLSYIHDNFDYDWCFSIDCDEFITPTEPFPSLLSDYSNYDGIMLHWKNYGCSDHIKKPIYDKPIWEIYDKECLYFKTDEKYCNCTKMCYNMKRFQDRFISLACGIHVGLCNYVRPNYTWDRTKPCFDRIYIRHYITKSFEEYMWKITKRGMTFENHRKVDDFFDAHPELTEKREEIVKWYNENVL